jgi:uncharacterized protein (TIGR00156 family)
MRILLASALALLLATPAVAAFEAGSAAPAQAGGFQGPGVKTAVNTVAKALKAADESPVMLEGRIISAGPEREGYVFQDSTGKIVIEIDDDLFHGRTVTPENTIRLWGEVDTKLARDSEVEVDRFDIVK